MRTRRPAVVAGALVVGVLTAEGFAQLAFKWRTPEHVTLFQLSREHHRLFERHPFLAIRGRPHAEVVRAGVSIRHNASGHRGRDAMQPRPDGLRTIVAFGGSSTYGTSLSEADTWPARLEAALGAGYEVLNFGIPGYSSVEHAIQTAFELSEVHAATAVYYVGWNDLRNAHVPNLDPYYADFHGRTQPANVGLDGPFGRYSALWFYLARLTASPPAASAPGQAVDRRGVDLFVRNMRSIVVLCRARGIAPVLVPQAVHCASLTADEAPSAWMPFIRKRDVCGELRVYTDALMALGVELNVPVAAVVADPDAMSSDDFVDAVHFTPRGAARFAGLIVDVVRGATLSDRPWSGRSHGSAPAH